MQAMILAAGLGTRLLPHSALRPKPLFPILNIPLLLLTIQRLQRAGCDHIIVNCHHLKEQVVEVLRNVSGVVIVEEEQILGTGGGLRNAMCHLRDEPLLVTNGDIYHTIDYRALYDRHVGQEGSVTLAMHDYPRFNTVQVKGDRVVEFTGQAGLLQLAFTGLQVLNPEILLQLRVGEYSCIIELYKKLISAGHILRVLRVDDCFWTDMGTPEDYLTLHAGLLRGIIPCWEELQGLVGSPFVVAQGAELADDCELVDWVSLGSVKVGGNVRLVRSVVWDDVEIPADCSLADELVSTRPNGAVTDQKLERKE